MEDTERAIVRTSHLRELNRLDEAEQVVRTALATAPDNTALLAELAWVLLRAERGTEGLEVASTLVALAPDAELGHRLRAYLLSLLNRHDEAIEEAATAVRLDPHDAAVRFCQAAVLLAAGRLTEARSAAGTTVELSPSWANAHRLLADILSGLGRRADARAAYTEALRLDPQDALARHNLAVLDLNTQHLTPALRGLIDAGAQDPNNTLLLSNVRVLLRKWLWRLRVIVVVVGFIALFLSVFDSPIWTRVVAVVIPALTIAAARWYVRRLPRQTVIVARAALRGDPTLMLSWFALLTPLPLYGAVLVTGSGKYLIWVFLVVLGSTYLAYVVGGAINLVKRVFGRR